MSRKTIKPAETAELFSTPDSLIPAPTPPGDTTAAAKPRKSAPGRKVMAKSSVEGATRQAYLPGLSRRGRPRSLNPVAPAVRAAVSRRKRLDSGARRIELMLTPNVAERLDALAHHLKESKVEIISRLILKAAQRVLD